MAQARGYSRVAPRVCFPATKGSAKSLVMHLLKWLVTTPTYGMLEIGSIQLH
ncbi:hypothetical protein QWZ13_03045 [Reinekea marina]|uniref:hypothetical protein n=1 Tax=Reinekea marina TaxID=1310421 RepID=UPI0025B2C63E|nr:hypothetical protein [Reinekea marina]MDN3647887.1 hypothetical protein [Reinekea marina]